MKRTLFIAFSLLACVLLLAVPLAPSIPAQGQNQAKAPAAPLFAHIQVIRVKPDMLTEWQEFLKNENLPAVQKAEVKSRDVWVTAIFGEAYEYAFVTPITDFAQYDGPSPVAKALGEEGARAYSAKARKMIANQHSYVVQARPDLSVPGKEGEAPKLAVVSWVRVAPGRTTEFENLVKSDVLPVIRKAGLKGYYVDQTILGGNAGEYITVGLNDSFADLGKGEPLARVLGQDGANKLRQKFAGIITNVERHVYGFVPELSLPQAQQKAENR